MMEEAEDYSQLTLKQILENEDLVLQEILAIAGIHTKIKINMKTFVQYCVHNSSFADKFINIGLKCPMHQSNNSQMKNFTYIAADVLTSDHQTLADLFILKSNFKEDNTDGEIQEEIQTEEVGTVQEADKYRYLNCLFQYLGQQELDENCVNYIAKTLATLVRKKISQYLEFFIEQPESLDRLVFISNFPSIAHLLAKMLTDDDDSLTDRAFEVKEKIIPLILERIHQRIDKADTTDVFEGLEDILSATRYSDNEERSPMQRMSDPIVSGKEVGFFLKTYFNALETELKTQSSFYALQNSIIFLSLLLNRMNMDEQHDLSFGSGPEEYTPTLNYEFDDIFMGFGKMITIFHRIWEYKDAVGPLFGIVTIKAMEPLTMMTKFSKFSDFYRQIQTKQRCQALQSLLRLLCTVNLNGVLLQSTSTLLQKMLTQQQNIADSSAEIVCPEELYLSVTEYTGAIGGSIAVLLYENRNQRNRNEKGIYFRKILLLLDNYFHHQAVLKRYPYTAKLQNLFPSFNAHNNSLYAEKTVVLDHPGGVKVQPVEEFKFIQKNMGIIGKKYPQLEAYPDSKNFEQKIQKNEDVEARKEPKEEVTKEITFKLNDKIKSLKDRVRQQTTDKDLHEAPNPPTNPSPPAQSSGPRPPPTNPSPPAQSSGPRPPADQSQTPPSNQGSASQSLSPSAKRSPSPKDSQQQGSSSPCKAKEPTGITFFIRHLMTY